jgi:hypothetical protein
MTIRLAHVVWLSRFHLIVDDDCVVYPGAVFQVLRIFLRLGLSHS